MSRKNSRRPFLILIAGITAVTATWLLSAKLYMKYQGASLIEYCNDSLMGESSNQVVVTAREAGFETIEGRELILLTMPGKRHGRTCYLSVGDGVVSDVKSAFRW